MSCTCSLHTTLFYVYIHVTVILHVEAQTWMSCLWMIPHGYTLQVCRSQVEMWLPNCNEVHSFRGCAVAWCLSLHPSTTRISSLLMSLCFVRIGAISVCIHHSGMLRITTSMQLYSVGQCCIPGSWIWVWLPQAVFGCLVQYVAMDCVMVCGNTHTCTHLFI